MLLFDAWHDTLTLLLVLLLPQPRAHSWPAWPQWPRRSERCGVLSHIYHNFNNLLSQVLCVVTLSPGHRACFWCWFRTQRKGALAILVIPLGSSFHYPASAAAKHWPRDLSRLATGEMWDERCLSPEMSGGGVFALLSLAGDWWEDGWGWPVSDDGQSETGQERINTRHEIEESLVRVPCPDCPDRLSSDNKSFCSNLVDCMIFKKQDEVFCAPTGWLSMCCSKNDKNALRML